MIIELRKLIQSNLKQKHPRVYFENQVPKNAEFPYLVYSFQPSFKPNESSEQLIVEIDGWDKPINGSARRLELLMEDINGNGDLINPNGLDKSVLENDEIMVVFRMESRMFLDEKKSRILRRKYTYVTTIYERSAN